MTMSLAFLVNYITGRGQVKNIKVNRWLSLSIFFQKKLYVKKQFQNVYVCMHHGPV